MIVISKITVLFNFTFENTKYESNRTFVEIFHKWIVPYILKFHQHCDETIMIILVKYKTNLLLRRS